jgi:hypothetical protein
VIRRAVLAAHAGIEWSLAANLLKTILEMARKGARGRILAILRRRVILAIIHVARLEIVIREASPVREPNREQSLNSHSRANLRAGEAPVEQVPSRERSEPSPRCRSRFID